MKYSSTRGAVKGIGFKEAVMMGLAEDGGLLVPDEFPQVHDRLQEWKSLPFQQLCLEIMELFVGQALNRDALEGLINRSFASFRHPYHSGEKTQNVFGTGIVSWPDLRVQGCCPPVFGKSI